MRKNAPHFMVAEADDPQGGHEVTMGVELIDLVAEGDEQTGDSWLVRVIEAGTSNNRNDYPLDVLHEGVDRFDGVPVIMRSDSDHVQDRGKSADLVVGWLEKPEKVAEGIDATLQFTDDAKANELKKKILSAWNKGKKDLLGLSLVADVAATLKRTPKGVVRSIRKIVNVRSVDVVVSPSAGGRFQMVTAGDNDRERNTLMNWKKLLKIVEARLPEEYKKLDLENIDEARVIELVEMVAEADAKTIEGLELAAEAFDGNQANQANGANDGDGTTLTVVSEALGEMKDLMGELKTFKTDLSTAKFDKLFDEVVAESNLPEDSHESIRRRLGDDLSSITREKVAEAVKDEAEYLSRHTGFQGPGSAFVAAESIRFGYDEVDKFRAALDGLLLNEDQPIPQEQGKEGARTIPRLTSVREAYIGFTGDVGFTGLTRNAPLLRQVVAEADLDAQWGYVLGDSVARAMIKEYRRAPYGEWRAVADTTPVKDFRTQHRTQLGAFSDLDTVVAGAGYTDFTNLPDDYEATYSVTKYGNIQPILMETIANDDVGAMQRLPRQIARAAKRTLSKKVWTPIITNANLSLSGDATALLTVGHGNTLASPVALSADAINGGYIAMMKQTTPTGSEQLNLPPRFLIVTVDQKRLAEELCYADGKPSLDQSTNTAVDSDRRPNFQRTIGLDTLVVPHLFSGAENDWWMGGDKGDCGMIEVGFFGGREEPEIFIQDAPTAGTMFTHDKLTYKVRHVYGTSVLDFRPWYGMINA